MVLEETMEDSCLHNGPYPARPHDEGLPLWGAYHLKYRLPSSRRVQGKGLSGQERATLGELIAKVAERIASLGGRKRSSSDRARGL